MVRMVRLPQHLPPLTPAVLRETVACRGPVLIPRQATPFRCRPTSSCVAARMVRRAIRTPWGRGVLVGCESPPGPTVTS